jgi:galactokinase
MSRGPRPGRVSLIGDHPLQRRPRLPAAIDLEIRIAYLPTTDRRVELVRLDGRERDGFDLDEPRAKTGKWLDYIAGTAWALTEAGLPLTGLRGVIASTLPPNAGLSSSAAIELAAAWALLDDGSSERRPLPARATVPARGERLCQVQSG